MFHLIYVCRKKNVLHWRWVHALYRHFNSLPGFKISKLFILSSCRLSSRMHVLEVTRTWHQSANWEWLLDVFTRLFPRNSSSHVSNDLAVWPKVKDPFKASLHHPSDKYHTAILFQVVWLQQDKSDWDQRFCKPPAYGILVSWAAKVVAIISFVFLLQNLQTVSWISNLNRDLSNNVILDVEKSAFKKLTALKTL